MIAEKGTSEGLRRCQHCGNWRQASVSGKPVFKVGWSEHWHGSVNCCTFLKNDHRFKDNHEFGKILHRVRMGTATLEDIKTINKRWLGNPDVELPTDGNICYAVPFNKDRNAIST